MVQRMAMFKTRLVCLCLVSTVVLSLLLFAVPHLHSDNVDDAAGASAGADVERRRSKFLVDTPGCKIPDIDPFDLSIRSMVTADNVSVVCNATPPMTYAICYIAVLDAAPITSLINLSSLTPPTLLCGVMWCGNW